MGVAANRVYVSSSAIGAFSPAVRLPVGEEWHRQGEGFGDNETTGHAAQCVDGGEPPSRGVWHTRLPPGQDTQLPRVWAGLSAGAALLAITGSAVGLLADGPIYSHETSALRNAAAAQDLVNLVLVGPLLLALAVRAYRGSLRSWLCWLGCLSFTVYNYAIWRVLRMAAAHPAEN